MLFSSDPHEALPQYQVAGEAEKRKRHSKPGIAAFTFGKVRFLHCACLEIIATVTSLGTGWVNKFAFGAFHFLICRLWYARLAAR